MNNKYEDLDIIGIDHGFGYVKTANFAFPAAMEVSKAEPVTLQNTVFYHGKYYTCGVGDKISVTDKKTANEDAFILSLLAIAKELQLRDKTLAKLHLAVGLPIKDFFDGKYRDEFRDYFEKRVGIKYFAEGEEYYIDVVSVGVYPQGYAAIADQISEKFAKMPVSLICDIGSLTTDIVPMTHGVLEQSKVESDRNHGIRQMYARIAGDVHQAHRVKVVEAQVEDVLIFKNNGAGLSKGIQNTIRESARKYMLHLVDAIKELGYDLRTCPIVFVGGGAVIMQNVIDSGEVENAHAITDIKANAIGYEKVSITKRDQDKL